MKKQKTYTTKQVFDNIKKSLKKKQPTVNAHLKKYLQEIVNKELAKKYRADAMKILLKAKRHEVAEFIMAYHSDGAGVGLCCIELDFIKHRMVKDKEVGENFAKNFGNKEL